MLKLYENIPYCPHAAIALNYSDKINIQNDICNVCQMYIYIYMKTAIQLTSVGLTHTHPNCDHVMKVWKFKGRGGWKLVICDTREVAINMLCDDIIILTAIEAHSGR